jgi:hypothetical protein
LAAVNSKDASLLFRCLAEGDEHAEDVRSSSVSRQAFLAELTSKKSKDTNLFIKFKTPTTKSWKETSSALPTDEKKTPRTRQGDATLLAGASRRTDEEKKCLDENDRTLHARQDSSESDVNSVTVSVAQSDPVMSTPGCHWLQGQKDQRDAASDIRGPSSMGAREAAYDCDSSISTKQSTSTSSVFSVQDEEARKRREEEMDLFKERLDRIQQRRKKRQSERARPVNNKSVVRFGL